MKHWLSRLTPMSRGILLGALSTLIVMPFFSHNRERDLRPVLGLRENLAAQQLIHDAALTVVQIPARYLSKSAIGPENRNLILQKPVSVGLAAGEYLRWHDLQTDPSAAEQLSLQVPQGFRAFSLPLESAQGLRLWLKPGDLVDVIGSFGSVATSENRGKRLTKTLFQNVPLLKTQPNLVFLVTPQQVELLTFAQRTGTLLFSLRNRQDRSVNVPLPESHFTAFLSALSPSRVPVARVKGPQIISLDSPPGGGRP